jgi:hypothetical protein
VVSGGHMLRWPIGDRSPLVPMTRFLITR